MEHIAVVTSETWQAIFRDLRDVAVTPGTSFHVTSGRHPQLGETMLVRDGQQAFLLTERRLSAVQAPSARAAA